MWVDSHVNLHGEKYADDLEETIARAFAGGIDTMLTICCKLSDFDAVLDVSKRHSNIWASVGTHPHEARENPNITPQDILSKTHHPKVIGIGETGLDFHYNYSDRDDQMRNLQAHIEAVRESGLPLIIHARNADQEIGDILENAFKQGEFPVLLHCYTSGEALAKRAAEMGLYFSVSGIITFKNAHDVRANIAHMPDDRILIETDCPYLSPVPHRGRRNEPAYVSLVGEKLAEIKGWSLEETARRTSDAFFNLFTKAQRPQTPQAVSQVDPVDHLKKEVP